MTIPGSSHARLGRLPRAGAVALRLLLCAVSCLGIARSCRGDDSLVFDWKQPISLPPLDGPGLVAVPLDVEAFDAALQSLDDLRVVDRREYEVPYFLHPSQELQRTVSRIHYRPRVLAQQLSEAGELGLILESAHSQPHALGLSIQSFSPEFVRSLSVWSVSRDGEETPLLQEELVYRLPRFPELERTSIAFPPGSSRKVRIVLKSPAPEQLAQLDALLANCLPLPIPEEEAELPPAFDPSAVPGISEGFVLESVAYWTERPVKAESVPRTKAAIVTNVRSEVGSDGQTVVNFDFRGGPLHRIDLEAGSRNFYRPAEVQTQGRYSLAGAVWASHQQQVVFDASMFDGGPRGLSVSPRDGKFGRYRVAVENGSLSPLDITGATAEYRVYDVVFLADPRNSYSLLYGQPQAGRVYFDVEDIEAAVERGPPLPRGELGVRVKHGRPVREPFDWNEVHREPRRTIVLGLAFAGLLAYLAKSRRTKLRVAPAVPGGDSAS